MDSTARSQIETCLVDQGRNQTKAPISPSPTTMYPANPSPCAVRERIRSPYTKRNLVAIAHMLTLHRRQKTARSGSSETPKAWLRKFESCCRPTTATRTMLLRFFMLALFVATSLPAQDSTILIRGARVFDGTQLLGERDVLIRGGRIAAVARRLEAPAGASVVAASGKTLLPGFIDAHTHTFADVLSQALAFGVTTQLEQFTDPSMVRRWHDEQRTGKANSRADVFSAGVLITAPRGHGTQFGIAIPTIASPDSAQAF